jgi:hypothetical protein
MMVGRVVIEVDGRKGGQPALVVGPDPNERVDLPDAFAVQIVKRWPDRWPR